MRKYTLNPSIVMEEYDFSIFIDCVKKRFGSFGPYPSEKEMNQIFNTIVKDWMCYLIDHHHNVIINVQNEEFNFNAIIEKNKP